MECWVNGPVEADGQSRIAGRQAYDFSLDDAVRGDSRKTVIHTSTWRVSRNFWEYGLLRMNSIVDSQLPQESAAGATVHPAGLAIWAGGGKLQSLDHLDELAVRGAIHTTLE